VAETADDIARAWLEYGKDYAKYPSLWDGSLAFASGPLRPEGGTLRDYSGKTGGAVWSVGAGDVPKYVQGSVRGQPFWAGQYDGSNDVATIVNTAELQSAMSGSFAIATWLKIVGSSSNAWVVSKYLVGSYVVFRLLDSGANRVARFYISDGANVPIADSTTVLSDGLWHSVICVKSVSQDKLLIYTDGLLTGSATDTTTSSISNTSPVAFSRNGDFGGMLAGLMIFGREPTTTEISILAQHPLAAYETVRPKYVSIPWAAPTTTKRALVRKSKSVDVGTDESSTIIRAWKEYGKEYAKYPNLWDGSLAFASGPLEPEGGTLRDYSGKTSGAVWSVGAGDVPKYVQGSVRGKPFWAGDWDGSNDYATFGSMAGTNLQTFTVTGWLRRNGTSSFAYPQICGNGNNGWALALEKSSNKLVAAKSFVSIQLTGTSAIADLTWTHFAFTCSDVAGAKSYVLWLNGAVDKTAGPTTIAFAPTRDFMIGADNGTPTNSLWLGQLSSVSVHSRILATSEISILAQHPLAAYETVRPKYWMFPTVTTNRRRRLLFACGA